MNIDPTKVGTVVPYRPVCEVCGEENEALATEIRKARLMAGGPQPMAVMMPLRPLNMCDDCRETLAAVLRAFLNSAEDEQQVVGAMIAAVTEGG